MPLEPYLRGGVYWIRGRTSEGKYIRQSARTSDALVAEAEAADIEARARKRRVLGADAPKPEDELTVAACVLLYPAKPKEARLLKPIVKRIGKMLVKDATPVFIRGLGKEMMPLASTDTWHRQIVTPIRAVINHAHGLGKCPPIRVAAYTELERLEQDKARGTASRPKIVPGSWGWVLAFCAVADPRDAALCRFMFTKGARITQSVAMLCDEDMDLGNSRLRLPAAKGHEAQWVEIDQTLVVMIANLPRRQRWQGANEHVFRIAERKNVYPRWKRACKEAGIPYLPPHDAGRHGFGTEMIVRQKVDPATAAKAGRWSSPVVPLKTYAHAEDFEAAAAAAMILGEAAARTQSVQPDKKGLAK